MELIKFTILYFIVVFLFLECITLTSSAKYKGKNDDENRPYEFGFNIEGEQHRKEKKDENGLIMGEFGFVTADGVYHVTVYATDENGAFRIISMKNIKLGPAPAEVPKPLLVLTPAAPPPPVPQQPLPRPQQPLTRPEAAPISSCSHCTIPKPISKPPQNQYNLQQNQPFQNPQNQYQNQNRPLDQQYQQNVQYEQTPQGPYQNQNNYQRPRDPALISANIQTVTPAQVDTSLRPGERPGLPAGITRDDMVAILYRFNYTVGFHGHYEEGYVNGFKKGEYYVNNRNGLATKVSYTADDTGYHPKIETVRLADIDTPREETEKNDEYGLKGYEFTWFYVPKYHYLNRQRK